MLYTNFNEFNGWQDISIEIKLKCDGVEGGFYKIIYKIVSKE